jgi:Spy/CpxP family protein refolding chaperone
MSRYVTVVCAAGMLVAAAVAAPARQRPPQRPAQAQAHDGQHAGGPSQVPQRAKWWQDEKIVSELRLTPEQSSRIDDVFQAFFSQMKGTAEDLNRREEQLSRLISGNDVTETQLLKEADQVEVLRGTLAKSRTLMLFRMRRVLSADQRTKLADIQKAQEQERRAGRSGARGRDQ